MGHESEPGPDPTPEPHTLLCLSFNQDSTCFAAGTSAGFRVYECDPAFRQTMRRDFPPRGALGFVHMLYRYSVFALVGSGPDSLYPTNQVQFWEDDKSCVNHHLPLRAEVRGIRLRRDRVVVVALRHKICVFDFNSHRPVLEIETAENPKGLCDVSQSRGPAVLACPGLHKGRVRVENFGSKRTEFITAHESSLACLALTHDGRFLATASEKGTLVRVFNTSDGALLQEVRRGTERAEIYCLAFSSTAQWLAVSSDKGTVHVFGVKVETYLPNSSGISSLSFFKGVLPKYFSSEWSVAKFHVPEGLPHIVAFGQKNNTIMILGMDGSFYRCQFDPVKGGQMTQLEHHAFLKTS